MNISKELQQMNQIFSDPTFLENNPEQALKMANQHKIPQIMEEQKQIQI